MSREATLLEPLPPTGEDGRLCVRVPWHLAERLQVYLRRHGVGSTLHFNSAARTAHLVLWTDADKEQARAALAVWQG